MYRVDTNCEIIPDYSYFSDKDNEFTLIEENQDIDIQSIEELDKEKAYVNLDFVSTWSRSEEILVEKINEVIATIKQLNRKINKE